MIIDFKEIPPANKANGQQDTFEQFAREFLVMLGYTLEQSPGRGPDGAKDLIVSEIRRGVSKKETKFYWLVSCKHKAHSKKSVNADDENDLKGRVDQHKCNGFMAFYSVIPSSPLNNKLQGLVNHGIEVEVFDNRRIESELLVNTPQRQKIIIQYFTNSFKKHKEILTENVTKPIDQNDIFTLVKTAIIILEIDKIKEEYFSSKTYWNEAALNKLYKFSDHTNEKIANSIFDFINSVTLLTRSKMPDDIANSIHSIVITFFPASFNSEDIENGKKCIFIGLNLVYDALIHLNNFGIAKYGLAIWKYIYRESIQNSIPELTNLVLAQYEGLEEALNCSERNDLTNAKKLVNVFKEDLNNNDLRFPVMPEYLYQLTLSQYEK